MATGDNMVLLADNCQNDYAYYKVILKWVVVPYCSEGQAEKWSFSKDLSSDFSRLSMTHFNTLFYIFFDQICPSQISKSTKKVLKTVFLDKFQTVPLLFYPLCLPILGLIFKFC